MTIKKKIFLPALTIVIGIGVLSYCGHEEAGFAKNGGSSDIHNTALIFAGKDIPQDSKLHSFTKTAYYSSYKQQIESGWKRLQSPNLGKIRNWWGKHKPAQHADTVLYPFSGPDIMNALTFFPDAENYIMFGLEPPGVIPEPQKMDDTQIIHGLNGLRNALGDILHMNFFKTIGMAAEMSNTSFSSTAGIILYFLATNDYTVLDARKIAIDAASNVVQGIPSDDRINWQNPPKSRVPGVEISFRKGTGKTQTVRYYMLNVIDHALTNSSPNFIPYLKKEGPYATIMKSASYLMHNDTIKFTQIRAAILASTSYLVQDDSGIPLRYFKPGNWKLTFHGYYDRPIGLFANRVQPDLKKAMSEKSTGRLPFSYGYDYKPGQSNLMTAEKIR
ncbi:MAG: hypothetical protein E4G96_00035 [Chrysiogenales bacterium]|nr:MAG: hypothetical protein E4G96_00035 [Chrysiogenales bacterium]